MNYPAYDFNNTICEQLPSRRLAMEIPDTPTESIESDEEAQIAKARSDLHNRRAVLEKQKEAHGRYHYYHKISIPKMCVDWIEA